MDFASLFVRDVSAQDASPEQLAVGCIAYDPAVGTGFGYLPSLAPGIVFTVVFAISVIAHICQTILSRKWWYFAFAIGALGELIGWAGRLASHYCPYNNSLFVMQIAILIIAPCFFSAGLYYILAELIRRWGREYSFLRPNLYLYIFISFDVLSIVLQGVGGGLASSAFSSVPPTSPTTGTNIMIGGICIQLAAMCAFSFLLFWSAYSARALWHRVDRRTTTLLLVTLLGDALILARNFYRAVELGEGWTGYLMTHEVYQCVFDAALMAICTLAFNIIHPAAFMPSVSAERPVRAKLPSESSDEEMAYGKPAQ